MTKGRKFITVVLLALVLALSLSISAFALEGDAESTEENGFTMIYGLICENADKIFSVLAFLGSLIIAFAYKRGLFPFIEKALGALSGAVGKLKEETEKSESSKSAFMAEINSAISKCDTMISAFSERLSVIEENLSGTAGLKDEGEAFKAIMLSEIEMLYEIFMSSSLPQYQKDRVGESYLRMKAKLGADEAKNEE